MSKNPPKLNNINPRKLLEPALVAMKDYCMLNYRDVSIDYDDTGAIVAIIIYFIAREPSIGMTKLECYLICLDRLSKVETGNHLFNWRLTKSGNIRNFKKLIEFMIDKQLISRRGNYQFNLLNSVLKIKKFPLMLEGIQHWMNVILNKFYYVTAKDLKNMLNISWTQRGTNQPQLPLLPNVEIKKPDKSGTSSVIARVNALIDKHQQDYESEPEEKLQEDEAQMLEKWRNAMKRHDEESEQEEDDNEKG